MNANEKNITLATHGLTVGYRSGRTTTVVASGLDLELRAGSVTALLGANGAGKSTLLRTLARQQPALAGSVEIGGERIDAMSLTALARKLSVVYTERTHAGALTVEEVVGLGRQPYTGFFGRLDSDDRRIVRQSMEAVGIGHLAGRPTARISDGERQKAMIARALAQQTPVMILDEPTSFLDVASRLEVVDLLSRLARDYGKSILLSTHDVADSLAIADDLWLMLPDHTIAAAPKATILDSPLMDRLFPGRPIRFDRPSLSYRINKDSRC